jgi:hypothetical protein
MNQFKHQGVTPEIYPLAELLSHEKSGSLPFTAQENNVHGHVIGLSSN